jgi:hypothetical protein
MIRSRSSILIALVGATLVAPLHPTPARASTPAADIRTIADENAEPQGGPETSLPPGGGPGARGGRPGAPGKGRLLLVLRLSEALHLSDEQTIRVASIFRGIQEKRQTLVQDRAQIDSRIEAELRKQPLDEATLTSLTTQAQEIDRKLALLPGQAFEEVGKDLNVEQRARLVVLKQRMRNQVMREQARRFGGPGGDGGGPENGATPGGGALRRRWLRNNQ